MGKRIKVGRFTVKAKCCRSKPRCKKCPVVALLVTKAEDAGTSGKALKKVAKQARKR